MERYRIMIVDDEPSAAEALRRVLLRRSEYFTVAREEHSARAALENLAAARPDLIFTDIKMPDMNGIEFTRQVMRLRSGTAVIVVSGYDDFILVHDAFIYGAEDYLLKPVNPEKFLTALDTLKARLDNRGSFPGEQGPEPPPAAAERPAASSAGLTEKIERYVAGHIAGDVSIMSVCRVFSISQPYLSRIFRKYRNCTFNDFVNSVKIRRASELLDSRQDLLIGTVAVLSGFTDPFYFSRGFKQTMGVTPSEYRHGAGPPG